MTEFVSPDRMQEILGDLLDELPEVFFHDLNLGVILREEQKMHAMFRPEQPIYIMGEYVRSLIGRQVLIYYGSFRAVHGTLPEERLIPLLRETLRHEFRHHLEYLAGEKDLELLDLEKLQKIYFGEI